MDEPIDGSLFGLGVIVNTYPKTTRTEKTDITRNYSLVLPLDLSYHWCRIWFVHLNLCSDEIF